jgi:hypothetical protein
MAISEEQLRKWKFCLHCGEEFFGDYMVLDRVWNEAGLMPKDGVCHLDCLEYKLGRSLIIRDFPRVLINKHIFFAYEMGQKSLL